MSSISVSSLIYEYQTIDVIGPLDVFSSGSQMVGKILKEYGPVDDETIAKAPSISYHHVGLDLSPVQLTGGVSLMPTCVVDEAPLFDILILGGPVPATFSLHPKYADYIRRHVSSGRMLFTNCTGSFVAALAGVLDGKNATINNVEFEWVKKRHPKVHWTKETKWVIDGNIWTAAGALAGMDMVAHWIKETYGDLVFTLSTMGLDFEPRSIDGTEGVVPKRYDSSGKQISTHVFRYYDSY